MGQPYYDQDSFRWREDDGSESGATWIHAANVNLSSPQLDYTYRLRYLLQNTGDKDGTMTPRLEYQYNGGSWTQVTTSSNYVRSIASSYVSDGTACTQQIGSGTHDEGYFDSNGSITGFTFAQQQESENEWCFRFRSADIGGGANVKLRVTNNGAALNLYSNTTSIDFPSGTFQQSHFRIRTGDTAGLNVDSGWAAALDTNATIDAEIVFRIRFEVEEIVGVQKTATLKLQQRKGAGTWYDLTYQPRNGDATACPAVFITDSAQYTDGDSTTNVLAGSAKTFVAGTGEENNTLPSLTLTNEHTEYEFALCIHTLYDGPAQNVDNDTFDFRLVESDGTPLGGSYVIPTITLNIPAGLIGGAHVESPGDIGPFPDGNGNLYAIVEHTHISPYNVMVMLKSADGGDTWSIMDAAGCPTGGDLESVDAQLVGNTIWILHQGPTSDNVWLHTFNVSTHGTSPDEWAITDELVRSTSGAADQSCAIAVLSDGRVRAFWIETGGTYEEVWYNTRSSGGSWGTPAQLDTASVDFYAVRAIVGESDMVHIFYKDDTNDDIYHRSLASDNTLSNRELIEGDAYPTYSWGTTKPVYWDDAGDEKIMICCIDASDGYFYSVVITNDGSPETRKQASDNGGEGGGADGRIPVATLAVNPSTKTAYLVYKRYSNQLGYRDEAVSDGGWGADVVEPLVDSADWICGNVFTHSPGNGGGTVLGMITDLGSDGGTGFVWYKEYELPGGQIVTFSATCLAQSVSSAPVAAIVREMQATAGGVSQTAQPVLAVIREMAASAEAASTTASAILKVVRGMLATMEAASQTSAPPLPIVRGMSASPEAASQTSAPAMAVVREMLAAALAASVTSSPELKLAGIIQFAAACLAQSASSSPTLAVVREMMAAAEAASTTPAAVLAVVREMLASMEAASQTSTPALPVVRSMAASPEAASQTSTPVLAIIREMLAEALAASVTSSPELQIAGTIQFAATCLAQSATSAPALAVLREMLAAASAASATSSPVLSVLREMLAAAEAVSVTSAASLAVSREMIASATAASATSTPAMAVLREMLASILAQSVTSDPELDIAGFVQFAATCLAASATSAPQAAVVREFVAVSEASSLTSSPALAVVRDLAAVCLAASQTSSPELTVAAVVLFAAACLAASQTSQPELNRLIDMAATAVASSNTSSPAMAVVREMQATALAQSQTSQPSLAQIVVMLVAALAQSQTSQPALSLAAIETLVYMIFSGRAPGMEWSGRKPDVDFSGRK